MSDSPKRIPRLGWAIAFVAAVTLIGVTFVSFKRAEVLREELPPLGIVPEFSFTSQTGETVTRDDLLGQVWVADFIFTRCPGPCPVMTSRMRELQSAIEGKGGDVTLVSVTVDPEHDTPEVLQEYAEKYDADPEVWKFLTGDPDEIIEFVQKGMLQPLAKGDDDLPVHSQRFLVVDAEGKIRSFHSLEDQALIPELLMDIGGLMDERNRRR